MRFILSILVMCTSLFMVSCGGSDSKDDGNGAVWTGYVKCLERGADTAVNPPRFPLIMTVNSDKSFSLIYYYNGKEAMTINGTINGADNSFNASVNTDFQYDESSTAKATFKFDTTVGTDGIGTGTYSITYDDSSIGATGDESGDIYVTTATTGIAGTWYGGYQGKNGSYDGSVKVVFHNDGSFTATHYETDSSTSNFSFTGTYTLTGSTFDADSSGVFSGSISSHTGTYPALQKGSLLINGAYNVNTGSTYTGFWALAKELK